MAILLPLVLRCRQRLYIAGGKAVWDDLDEPDLDDPVVGCVIRGYWVGRGVYEEQAALTDEHGHFEFVSPPFWAAPGARPLRFIMTGEGYPGEVHDPEPWAVRGGDGWVFRAQDQEKLCHSAEEARAKRTETERQIRERRARKLARRAGEGQPLRTGAAQG
ncbi:MAG: hypothetical protein FJX75_09870 [Armatimonadetes bacterium]|nr:hypothetical protein [Armatimonadota bacterium]